MYIVFYIALFYITYKMALKRNYETGIAIAMGLFSPLTTIILLFMKVDEKDGKSLK